MATTTITLLQDLPTSVPVVTATAAADSQPPIVYFYESAIRFLALAASTLVVVSGYVWTFLRAIISPVVALVDALSSPIRYLLSPAFVLINILLEIFVYIPYNFFSDLGHAFYPIYTFVFIAVAFAGAIGFSARIGTYLAKMILLHTPPPTPQQQPPPPVVEEKQSERSKQKMPARRVVQIKEEPRPPRPSVITDSS